MHERLHLNRSSAYSQVLRFHHAERTQVPEEASPREIRTPPWWPGAPESGLRVSRAGTPCRSRATMHATCAARPAADAAAAQRPRIARHRRQPREATRSPRFDVQRCAPLTRGTKHAQAARLAERAKRKAQDLGAPAREASGRRGDRLPAADPARLQAHLIRAPRHAQPACDPADIAQRTGVHTAARTPAGATR